MSLRNRLRKDLIDPEFRHAYADEHLNLSVATQIKVIREQKKLSQKQLAEKLKTKQAGVSRLESANYDGWSVRVLRKLAEAFDLRLRISFEEFGTLWHEVDCFSRESLQRRSFNEDSEFKEPVAPTSVFVSREHVIPSGILSSVRTVPRQPTAVEQSVTSTDQSRNRDGQRRPPSSALENWAGTATTNSVKGGACI